MIYKLLDENFYRQETVVVARMLLGTLLCHETEDGFVSGKIVETEAYLSNNDPACHASRGKTKRNATMFGEAGKAYIYFIYGKYYCFNVVTGAIGRGEAALIRAVEPVEGLDIMKERRRLYLEDRKLTNGPGKLCIAFSITSEQDGHSLEEKPLYITEGTERILTKEIIAAPRIGISVAKERRLRFFIKNNYFVSRREKID